MRTTLHIAIVLAFIVGQPTFAQFGTTRGDTPRVSVGGVPTVAQATDDATATPAKPVPTDVDENLTDAPATVLPAAIAQTPPTIEEIDELDKRVQQVSDPTQKDVLAKELGAARQALADAKKNRELIPVRVEASESAEARAAKLTSTIEERKSVEPLPIDKTKDLGSLEIEYETAKANGLEAERQRKIYEEQLASAPALLRASEEELAGQPKLIATLQENLQALPGDLDPLLADVRASRLRSQLLYEKIRQNLLTADATFRREAARVKLFDLEKQAAVLQSERLRKRVSALQAAVAAKRQEVATEQMTEARETVKQVDESLKPEAESIQKITEELTDLGRRIGNVEARKSEAQADLNEWDGKLEEIEKDIDARGLTEIVGLGLREKLSRLPNLASIRERRSSRSGRLREAQLRKYSIESELPLLEDTETAVSALMSTALADSPNVEPDKLAAIRADAERLVEQRKEKLTNLKETYGQYIAKLQEVDKSEQYLITTVTSLSDFITGRMLWIRSHPSMVDLDSLEIDWTAGERARWFLLPSSYVYIANGLMSDLARHPLLYLVTSVFLAVLLIGRHWLRYRIRIVADKGRRRANVSVRPLLRTIGMTIADAAMWPGLIAFVAMRLQFSFSDDIEIVNAASGLVRLALALFLTELVHDSCAKGGVAELLGIPADVAHFVRKKVRALELLGVPLAFLVVLLHNDNLVLSMRAVERLCFVVAMCLLARFNHQLLRSRSPVVAMLDNDDEPSWTARFRPVFWLVGMAVPLAIGMLSIVGYHNTALQLSGKLELTIWLGLSLLTIRLVLGTAIMLHRRRLRFEEIRRKVDESRETLAEPIAPTNSSPSIPMAAEIVVEAAEDSETLSSRLAGQSQRFIATIAGLAFLIGVYFIWKDVLPALDVVSHWSFYSIQTAEGPIPITIGRILAGAIAVALTITATRNLPGFVELSVLQRIGLDHSVRYAITTILSYIISVIGLLITGNLIGLNWSSVQWLAAGLTVGLGFGLQEIFANFISGLIIFFEQPVRVGDVVTLGDVTGVVSRIRMRATTITNWDRKEYIVPNKEFITGRLLNWTLSDSTNRLVLTVGVAYGSDTDRARDVLLDILDKHELVLKEPGALVTLEELGSSSVNFTIRCYLSSLENRLSTTHELYTSIHRRFIDEGIEIPFPQTDVHIRDVAALPIVRQETA